MSAQRGIADQVLVDAVVVTYFPENERLALLLRDLSPQVRQVHIVDNTPKASASASASAMLARMPIGNARLIALGDNLGLAVALNVGILAAREAGATHVLLSDQDSEPAHDMVARLVAVIATLQRSGTRVGAVGPTFTDRHTGTVFPFQAIVPGKVFYGHVRATEREPIVEALSLITSGTLIPMDVIDEVGAMREDFFVDRIDIEWCLRARSRGWKIFGTKSATMFHHLGDRGLRVWYFGWRMEVAYSPLRLYYQCRNFVAMLRSPFPSWRWKARNAWYALGVVYSHAVFGSDRLSAIVMSIRGLRDGIIGRMGRFAA